MNSPITTNTPRLSSALPYDIISVCGEDATTFLQSQFTCDIHQVTEAASPAAYCDRKGKVLCRLHIRKKDNEYQLLVHNSNTASFMKTIKRYSLFSRLELTPLTDYICYGLIGNRESIELPPTVDCWSLNNTLAIFQTSHEQADALSASLEPHITSCDENAWRHALQLASYIEIHPETSLQFTPQMLGMDKHSGLCFNKGCYLGQEVIARTQHLGKVKRGIAHFTWHNETSAAINSNITDQDNRSVGTLLQMTPLGEQQFFGTACFTLSALSSDLFLLSTPISLTQ